MKSLLIVTAVAMCIAACATHDRNVASTRNEQTDAALACRYAPVIFNGVNRALPMGNQDHPLHVLYDVAETDTHVYISYNVMKSWSEFSVVSFLGHSLSNAAHAMDTEDVFYILQKTPAGLTPVFYSTNAHGNRIYYSAGGAVIDLAEARTLDTKRLKSEGKRPFSPSSWFDGFRNRGVVTTANEAGQYFPNTYADERPIVESAALDHALTGASVKTLEKLKSQLDPNFDLLVPACADADDRTRMNIGPVDGIRYELVPATEVLAQMTYSEAFKNYTKLGASPCPTMNLSLNGQSVITPALPRYADTEWYLNHYRPRALSAIRERYHGKKLDQVLYQATASFFFAKEGDSLGCGRLDPAAIFARDFPRTFQLQSGSRNYMRYELLSTVSPEYSHK